MSLLNSGESLVKFVANKVKGFEVRRIDAVSGIYVTDVNGYIGIKINDYFSQNGSPYPGNYALVARGPDYSSMGLGRVTFLEETTGSVTIGDKTYRTVIMPDGKEWMAENLDFKDEGISINPSDSPYTAAAWYYDKDEVTYGWEGKKYGLLYNWVAAKALTIAGWHLPSSDEWDALATACGGRSTFGTKAKSTTGWTSGNGQDIYGFTVLPGGYYHYGSFSNAGSYGSLWTSTESSSSAYYKYFNTDVSMSQGTYNKIFGCSVRLVKDPDPSEAGA